MSPFKIIIPARYASTRLPAKPLMDIAGKPMVVRVLECVAHCGADEVWVATDHQDVVDAVHAAGGRALMTSANHSSGTDRLSEVVNVLNWKDDTIVVNVQGDEPLIDPHIVQRVAACLEEDAEAAISTAAHVIHSAEEFLNPSVVKVVCNAQQHALYFSRAPIPFARDATAAGLIQIEQPLPALLQATRHIGIYGYRCSFLRAYAHLTPSPLESIEMLEQLRALWHDYKIRVEVLDRPLAAGVDTPEDLERVRRVFEQKHF